MIRFLFRLLSMLALSVAVIMAVLDATRSIAGSALIMTPLSTSWAAVSADTLASAREMIATKLHPLVWDLGIAPILSLPGFIVSPRWPSCFSRSAGGRSGRLATW